MGRGLTRARLCNLDGAIVDCEKSVALRPDADELLNNFGTVLVKRREYSKAIEVFRRAGKANPANSLAFENEARALAVLKNFAAAKNCYEKAVALNPNSRWVPGELLSVLASACDWAAYESQWHSVLPLIRSGAPVCKPFTIIATPSDLGTRKLCSETYSRDKYIRPNELLQFKWNRASEEKITVAYLSSDFYNHATSYLIAEMFELHDRSRFNVVGVCYGASPADEMRLRVTKSFDQFIEAESISDSEIAALLKRIGVDIAVDLKGHTKDSRLGIFAERIAPIQMHYLGYPGTIGAGFIDYLIADETIIPDDHKDFYTEKIVYMPDSYQVNDRLKEISKSAGNRSDHGLPENGFVFCCFNNNWKITPDVFNVWMRLLSQVEGSVLWLLEDNEEASKNLMLEAAARGLSADKIVFAKRAPLADHLARHRHADLFLDTFHCNAHTTASDALWAGLPLITLLGETFASRVSASLLKALDLQELVVDTIGAYESLALELATNTEKLAEIRQKLSNKRLVAPLFDTPRFTGNLERAYEAIWQRHQAGLSPDHIHIQTTGVGRIP